VVARLKGQKQAGLKDHGIKQISNHLSVDHGRGGEMDGMGAADRIRIEEEGEIKYVSFLMFEWVMTGPIVAAVLRFGFRRGGRLSQQRIGERTLSQSGHWLGKMPSLLRSGVNLKMAKEAMQGGHM
jgi:hypothetical protein